nr:DUF3077 domain-containing protein [Pseudomonas sp. Marseille-Q3773]
MCACTWGTLASAGICIVRRQSHPLFRIEPGIPCRDAREQASELLGYVHELTILGLMEEKPMMIWASRYLSAMAKPASRPAH